MPEFIPVLIAAVLVFAGLLLAFGAIITVPPSPHLGGGGALEDVKHISLENNFTVGYVTSELSVANISGTISRGLLSGEDKEFSFLLSEPLSATGGRIILDVNESNLYGRLMVKLNGNELYNDFAYQGNHSIPFEADILKPENVLEISAESSGWRFWAPTVYKLSAETRVEWKGALYKTFNFTLSSNDASLATKGRLVVNVKRKEGSGQLTAKLNNEIIYADTKTAVVKDFTSDKFLTGTNILELSAPAGTRYTVDAAEIIIYFT